ncbi:MAG: hypothetical protein M1813_008753 [Trichoglossum hirsutum]|nr:MAG: hypothetical protein M1813_008753 [Trichoglossum hirsutum]
MADPRSEIIKSKPIEEGLNAFRKSFNSASANISELSDAVEHMHIVDEDLKNLVVDLILALQNLPAARLLPSRSGRGTILGDLQRFGSLVDSDDFDAKRVIPLLKEVTRNAPDVDIWDAVYSLVTESTPPPRLLPYSNRTPISFNTGSLANTSEYRKYFDGALKDELNSSLYVDVPGFYDTFFGEVTGLQSLAEVVFKKCQEGEDPLYKVGGGWRYWPKEAPEKEVLEWFKEVIDKFLRLTEENGLKVRRRPLGQPSQHLSGSTAKRKLDIGFANGIETSNDPRYDWSQILVPGELKSNPNADKRTDTWLDLARYARHVLIAQDTRRFVLGFTLCGSIMRLWEFDRLGGIASSPFDINKEGLQFVSAVLGYLWMNEEQLGFDPTILESDGKRYVEITRNNKTERLVIVELIKRHSSVAGRATTTWKAYRDGDESKMVLVIKDSWQYLEREEEGELLREATEKGVVNVARYYHHETVHVGGKEDDISGNVRKGLAIKKATDAFLHTPAAITTEGMVPTQSISGVLADSRSRNAGQKRSSSSLNVPLPPHKRSRSTSPHVRSVSPNRVHRRVIVRDYGKHIYKASSQVAMLAALEGNIEGHESLRDSTAIIQSDVSVGNLMMNEEKDNPSWPSFIIDLDLAIRENRENSSGAPSKTGTRAFMAIGALYGEEHTFMHDLESFFWVLFWICIHYTGPGRARETEFEFWNYENTTRLAEIKQGMVVHEGDFIKKVSQNFTPYHQPLIPWVNRLRRVVFPEGKRWERKEPTLYSQMKAVLEKAREDLRVSMKL